MSGNTKQAAEETRCDLLNAAVDLFLEKGVARVTLEQIARAAGYTRGAIYHHFRNKSEILEELMLSVRLPLEEFLQSEADANGKNPLDVLQRRCERAMVDLFQDERRLRIHTILLHRCEFVEELNPLFREIIEHDRQLLALSKKSFEKARDAGTLRPDISPGEAAFALHSFASGLYWNYLREPGTCQGHPNVPLLLEIFFTGLRPAQI